MARLLSVALAVLLIVGLAQGSWLSDATGVNIEPNKPITVGPPDPIGATEKAIPNLPKTIMELPGAPLAEAIRRGRERAIGSALPMPGNIRSQLAPFYSPDVLNRAKYTTDWGASSNGTLQQLVLGAGDRSAVTLEDVIVFQSGNEVQSVCLWAHELKHVEQYGQLGTDTFANQYVQNSWVLENAAIDKANSVCSPLRPPPVNVGGCCHHEWGPGTFIVHNDCPVPVHIVQFSMVNAFGSPWVMPCTQPNCYMGPGTVQTWWEGSNGDHTVAATLGP